MHRRVLIVDDEPALLRVMERELRGSFDVVTARDYADALAKFEGAPDIAAVITDHSMGPGPDGIVLIRELERRAPALLRILVSGTARPEGAERAVADGAVHLFVAKPWQAGTLRKILESRLTP